MKKNPIRCFENIHQCCNGKSVPYFKFFIDLYNLAVNRFEWVNLPKEINPYFLEDILFWRGSALFIYDDVADMYAVMKEALVGMMDIYNIPETREAFAVTGYLKDYYKDNSVIIWNNPAHVGYVLSAQMYAEALDTAWKTKNLNMYAQRTPIALVSSDEQKLSYQIFGENYDNYVPVIKLTDSFDLDKVKAINMNAPYVVDKLEQEIKEIYSMALNDLGYETNNIEKKERVTNKELDGNNGQIEGMRSTSLSMRKRACEAINNMFGLDVDVKFRSILPSFINGFVNENFTTSDNILEGGGDNE